MDLDRAKHRFFVELLNPPAADLLAGEAHHALHVLRLKKGQTIELFDGQGRWASGPIVEVRRDRLSVAIDRVEGPAPRMGPAIHLAFAVPKGKRLDWLLEKVAELGVASLQPLLCQHSVAGVGDLDTAQARWRAICAAAVRQSRQVYLPEILSPASLVDVVSAGPRGLGIIAHGGADTPPLWELLSASGPEQVQLLIGPEGGWAEEELRAAERAGFRAGRLGQTILRVETAAVVVVAGTMALCRL